MVTKADVDKKVAATLGVALDATLEVARDVRKALGLFEKLPSERHLEDMLAKVDAVVDEKDIEARAPRAMAKAMMMGGSKEEKEAFLRKALGDEGFEKFCASFFR